MATPELDSESLQSRLQAMMRAQAHRGPDDRGEWYGEVASQRIALGHPIVFADEDLDRFHF
jgi:asparagine synthetase B (glutamine-hydrolysing)